MNQSHISDFMNDLGEAARRNPLSAGLIGAGVVWLLVGNRIATVPLAAGRRVGEIAGDAMDAAATGFQSGTESLSSGVSAVRRTLAGGAADAMQNVGAQSDRLTQSVGDRADSVRDWGSDTIDNVRDNMTTFLHEQPLALAALGLAAGAAIAASLPVSDFERDHLSNAASFVSAQASETVDSVMARGNEVLDAVTDEMKRQKLTTEDAKRSVSDVASKVSRAASSVKID
jgi:hypothetical protein